MHAAIVMVLIGPFLSSSIRNITEAAKEGA